MKANHKILIKLLPTLVIMAGCALQPGTDDQSSQGEALSEGANTTVDVPNAVSSDGVKAAQPTNHEKTQRRTVLAPNTLHGQVPHEPMLSDGVNDPGGPSQDDDGDEPVPNPWAPRSTSAVPVQH